MQPSTTSTEPQALPIGESLRSAEMESLVSETLKQPVVAYYQCPEELVDFGLAGKLSGDSGYFRFGPDVLCYGYCSGANPARAPADGVPDALPEVALTRNAAQLPFRPDQIVANLRCERYLVDTQCSPVGVSGSSGLRNLYYSLRPILPVGIRKYLQRFRLKGWDRIPFPSWPVDRTVDLLFEKLLSLSMKAKGINRIPFIWFWPEGAPGCAIVTHDVEAIAGRDFCRCLMDLDDYAGIKSSFQIVPEGRYSVPASFLDSIRERGFEINVHDLNHDGHLFSNRKEFLRRAGQINRYAKEYGALGFRSGALYRNVDWFDALNVSYDMSVPNVGHLEPQRGGCCTVMPFFIGKILELPLTTTQDYSLFHILSDYSIELWKHQIGLVMERHGLVSSIVHPDYVIEKRARDTYKTLLEYLAQLRSTLKIWIALPKEVDRWWRQRRQMKLVRESGGWRIEGPGKERARIVYATLDGDRIAYSH